jgi:hypothetical protein
MAVGLLVRSLRLLPQFCADKAWPVMAAAGNPARHEPGHSVRGGIQGGLGKYIRPKRVLIMKSLKGASAALDWVLGMQFTWSLWFLGGVRLFFMILGHQAFLLVSKEIQVGC